MAAKSGNDIITLGLLPLGGVVGAFLIAAAVAVFVLAGLVDTAFRQHLANERADAMAHHFNARLVELGTQLRRVSGTIRLGQVFEMQDPAMLSLEEAGLTQLIPHAERVRLFPIGAAKIERNAVPEFSFPSLDLVNRVERNETTHPEALESNGRWLVSVALPVRAPSSTLLRGTMFVYLDARAFTGTLPDDPAGQVRLVQTFAGGTPTVIMSAGEAPPQGSPTLSRSLSSAIWTVEFQPSAAMQSVTLIGPLVYLLPVVVALLIGIAVVGAGIVRAVRTIEADADWLSHQFSAVATQRYSPSTAYNLRPFTRLDERLGSLPTAPTATPLPPLEEAATGASEEPADSKTSTATKVAAARLATNAAPPPQSGAEIEEIDDEDFEKYLQIDEKPADADSKPPPTAKTKTAPEPDEDDPFAAMFRACDIRALAVDLNDDTVYWIGRAVASEALARGEQVLALGADARSSSEAIVGELIRGLTESGCNVINLGTVPTPLLYFATTGHIASSGVMVTGSGNPAEYNGFKIVLAGEVLGEDDLQALWRRVVDEDVAEGEGELSDAEIVDDYIDAIVDDVVVAQSLKVVVDCGNGVSGTVAPELYTNLGCEVIPLNCEPDGRFPNRSPDPLAHGQLAQLIDAVSEHTADLGIALDNDGDALVAVTADGQIIWPDQLLMLFAQDVVSRNPGSDVVHDVMCTRHLNSVISGFGGRPIICPGGHAFIKRKMRDTDAVLGGEMSGHIYFTERWHGFDDGLYSGARLLEILGQSDDLGDLIDAFPHSVSTPVIQLPVANAEALMERIGAEADFGDGSLTHVDGVRIDFADGWGLVRASNTQPCLMLRFEADDEETLADIILTFNEQLSAIDASLVIEPGDYT